MSNQRTRKQKNKKQGRKIEQKKQNNSSTATNSIGKIENQAEDKYCVCPLTKTKETKYGWAFWGKLLEVVFISGASVIVSICSLKVSQLEYDLNLANSQLHVNVISETEDTDLDGIQDTQQLGVQYVSGVYDNFHLQYRTIVSLGCFDKDNAGFIEYEIQIPDYFFVGYTRGDSNYMYLRRDIGNWAKYVTVDHALLDEEYYGGINANIKHYIIITYKNVIGETVEVAFGGSHGILDQVDIYETKKVFQKEFYKLSIDEFCTESIVEFIKQQN